MNDRDRTNAELKRAQEALRQNEETYRGLVDACPDAVVMSDLEGKVLFASRQTWSLLGLSASDELVGRSVFDFVIDADRPRLAANMAQLLQAGVRRDTQYTALRSDGTTVPAEASSTVVRDAVGRAKAVMAVLRDVTAQKRAREALERERRTLQHMLQASDHERQLIAYDIHDGLAQELAGAIMQFQIYEQFQASRPDEAQKAFDGGMTLLRQGHAEARRLISGVRPPVLDESGVITAVAHLAHDPAFAEGPKIDFRSRVTFRRLSPILENAIYRIVQEGLNNARIHSHSKRIVVQLQQHRQRLRIEIRDWGVGFDPRQVQENRFGLDGIRQRARLLGGRSSIKSTPGEGTTILVDLPLPAPPAET